MNKGMELRKHELDELGMRNSKQTHIAYIVRG